MLIKPRIGFTYDCEFCRKPVNGCADLFSLFKSTCFINCDCGKSRLDVFAGENTLYIDYPCSLCGKRHRDKVSVVDAVEGIAELRCPVYSLPACYIGQAELIEFMDSEDAENELTDLILSLISPDR